MILGGRHDYYDPDTAPQVRLRRVGPMPGLRAAYFPLAFLGVEAEGWGIWTQVPARADAPVFLYALRGQGILQLPLYRVAPFVLGGYGLTGVRSPRDAVGNDLDPAGHYGAGVKLMVDDRFAVRLEGRHTMGPARARRRQVANHFSIMVGLSVRLGPQPTRLGEPPVHERRSTVPDEPDLLADSDGGGLVDFVDRCPWEKSTERDGCVAPPELAPAAAPVTPRTD